MDGVGSSPSLPLVTESYWAHGRLVWAHGLQSVGLVVELENPLFAMADVWTSPERKRFADPRHHRTSTCRLCRS